MEFRAQVEDHGSVRTVRLAGRLGGEQVADLAGLCDEVPGKLRLDLSDLLSADAIGLETLTRLARRGVGLVGASPYLTLQLQMAAATNARHVQDDEARGSMNLETNIEGRSYEKEDE